MSKRPHLGVKSGHSWSNWHGTNGVGGPVGQFWTPHNIWLDGSLPSSKKFRPGLLGLQEVVRQAETNNKRVRAIGSSWSLSPVAFTEEYLVNTARLRYSFRLTAPSMLEPGTVHGDGLVFAQCGVQIKSLNVNLERRGFCLPTAGASNGQTIVGALSTGTHGSARDGRAVTG